MSDLPVMHVPIPRLRHFGVGAKVILEGKTYVILSELDQHYYQLSRDVIACKGHPCEEAK